jgi:hypothetical protein
MWRLKRKAVAQGQEQPPYQPALGGRGTGKSRPGKERLIKEAEAKGPKRPPDEPGIGSGKGRLRRKAESQRQERPPYQT